jgi:transcriptional regulator with XRE-family HTH domain
MKIDDVEKHIGQQLKMLRISNKMSQKALAEKLDITYQQVQKYEMGMNRISVARVWQFCKIFSVTPDFLFENLLNLDDKNAKAGELIPNVVATSQDIKLMLAFKKIESGDNRNLIIKMCQAFAKE